MKASIRLFTAIFLLFSLSACWGDKDAVNDNSTNKNTAIDLRKPATFTGKYIIDVYKETYDESSIDTADMDDSDFKGEIIIKSGDIPTEFDYGFTYIKDNQTYSTGRKFDLIVGASNKLQIDPSKIDPAADKVYNFNNADRSYLIIQLDGLTQVGSNKKYDLYIGAEKISDNPDYKE